MLTDEERKHETGKRGMRRKRTKSKTEQTHALSVAAAAAVPDTEVIAARTMALLMRGFVPPQQVMSGVTVAAASAKVPFTRRVRLANIWLSAWPRPRPNRMVLVVHVVEHG